MAIVHIAMFEAANAIAGRYQSYVGLAAASPATSMDVAVGQAAHDTLTALFPSQKAVFDEQLAHDLSAAHGKRPTELGIALGQRAAAAILALRSNDGSARPEPRIGIEFTPGNAPGDWPQDPITQSPIALGAYGNAVKPFVLTSSVQFRVDPPPALNSAEYATAFAEVKALGGDGITTPKLRTPEQTEIGMFWAYDGTPTLCAPPRLYNQIATHIADPMGTDVVSLARLLGLVKTAMADAGIAIWESKDHYGLWRPIAAIRESDQGTGPSGLGDGNAATAGDPTFTPLGAPASNLTGPNFTPPFPAYLRDTQGLAAPCSKSFAGSMNATTLHLRSHPTSSTASRLITTHTWVRPLIPRSFGSLTEAEEENGQSRIYLGIHWAFDKTQGIDQGRRVAQYVFSHAVLPAPSSH